MPRALTVGLFAALLGAGAIPAHERLPGSHEWNDFPVEMKLGRWQIRRSPHAEGLRLRINFQPELQRSVDSL